MTSSTRPGRRRPAEAPRLRDLASYDQPFVTPDGLADYFGVSRRYIRKEIEAGHLQAVRLGPRSLRVPIEEAVSFERRSRFLPDGPRDATALRQERSAGTDGLTCACEPTRHDSTDREQ